MKETRVESCPSESMANCGSLPSTLQVIVSPLASVAISAVPTSVPAAVFSARVMVTVSGPPMTGAELPGWPLAIADQAPSPIALTARTRTEYMTLLSNWPMV